MCVCVRVRETKENMRVGVSEWDSPKRIMCECVCVCVNVEQRLIGPQEA